MCERAEGPSGPRRDWARAPPAVRAGLRAGSGLRRRHRGDLRLNAVSVTPHPAFAGAGGTRRGGMERGEAVGFRHKNMHLFFLFVCLSKENCNWNSLIFKRIIRDGMVSWGPCSPRGQVRDALLGRRTPASPGHLGQAGSSVPFESRTLCVCQNEVHTSMRFFFPPFLYNNYITYAFIHYELISASQRYMTKETISDIMWP